MASPPTTSKSVLRLREKFEQGKASAPQNPKRSLSESAHRTVVRGGRNVVKPPGPPVNAGPQPSREPGPGKVKWPVFQPPKEPGNRKVSLTVTTTTSPRYAKPGASSSGQKVKNEVSNSDKNREPSKMTSSKVKFELITSSTSKPDGSKPDLPFKGKNLLDNKSAKIGVQQVKIIRSHAKDSDDQSESQTQEKTLTVAERARIFSADEPQSSAPCQRKQRPPEFAGSQAALAAYQWEETGSQGDDEGLTSPVGHPHGPAMNRKIKLNQEIQDDLNQPSRNREIEWNQVDRESNSSASRFQRMIPKWLRNREPVRTGSQVDLRPAPKWASSKNTQWYDTRAGDLPLNEDSSCIMSGREASRSALDSPSKSGNSQANSSDAPHPSHPDNFKPSQMPRKPLIPARKTFKDSLGEAISQQPVKRADKPVLQIPIRNPVASFESPKKVPPLSQARKERELATRQDEATVSVSSEKPNKPSPKQKEPTFSQTCLTSAETVQKPVAMPSSQLKGNPTCISTTKVGDISQKSGPSKKQPSQLGIHTGPKPLPDIPPLHEIAKLLNLQDPNTNNEQSSLSSDKVEDPQTNSKTETSLQDTLQANSTTTAGGSQNLRKPVPAARSRRRPGVTLVDGLISGPLSQVPEDEVMKISCKPKPIPRDRKLKEHLAATSDETHPLPAKPTEYHNIASDVVEVPVVENSADVLDSKNKTTEINAEEKVEADTDTTLKERKRPDTNPVQFVETTKDDACLGSRSNLSKSAKDILLTHSENDDSDNEDWTCNNEGSDVEAEKQIIPLRENKLLLDTGKSDGLLRRTSSLDDLPVGNNLLPFCNTRGLFQRARLLKSNESLDTTAKPPLPQKPTLPKKPSLDDTGCETGKPRLSPRIAPPSPPRLKPKTPPVIQSPKPPEKPIMEDDIYDTVCPDEMNKSNFTKTQHERTSLMKLEKVLGPGFVANNQSGSTTETSKPQKAKKPMDLRVRKMSPPAQQMDSPDDGPYAVIPLPDAEKTAAKNTRNVADPTTPRNGNNVTLRNSGGMSSGDSGIVGIHGDLTHVKRTMSKKERRISRRVLRQKMRSIDSDFMEDSDDEPIGADSDFDSDESIEEPAEFVDDTHKQAFEVLTTERTYVETLYLISNVFLAQIQAENEKQHWFPPTVLNEIFSNIKTIYELHSVVLLPELEKRLKEWEKKPCLGEVLKTVAPFLKLYSDYVSNFNNAMKQLNFWTSKVPKFAASIADKQKHQLCGNLALQHHMLTPIQRIPRYELLLKEYLKKLPSDSKDRPDAEKALNIISGAAQHSNNMMKSMDQFEKLLKINEKIDGENIIHPTRRLLKEGKITKITAKNKELQDRYIFLFNDILLCCEKKGLLHVSSTTYKVKLKMEVNGMKVLDSSSCRFIIEGKNKTIEIQASSEEEREEWMKELLSAICEMVRKKETFKMNDAVADRENEIFSTDGFLPGNIEPRWIRDDETTMCMRCGTEFKLTKRRHHCRACGAVVCHKCSNYEAALQYDEGRENKVCFKCYFTLNGDEEELEKLARKSLLTEIDENNSFASYLFIQHKGVWTKFWVAVTDQELYAFKAPKDVRPVFTIQITQCSVHDLTDSNAERDHVFKLSEGRTIHTLSADTRELKRRWLDVLLQGVRDAARRSVTL